MRIWWPLLATHRNCRVLRFGLARVRTCEGPIERVQESDLKILFVCTGNICRSPVAERLFSKLVPTLNVSSAGTRAVIGHPIHDHAGTVLAQLGGDPTGFSARQLTLKVASSADLILTMTRAHRDAALNIAPKKIRSTFTLVEASRLITDAGAESIAELAELRPHLLGTECEDIFDPIGGRLDTFFEVGTTIANLLIPMVDVCARSAAEAD